MIMIARRTPLTSLLVGLFALTLGCKKSAAQATAPESYGTGGDDDAMGDYAATESVSGSRSAGKKEMFRSSMKDRDGDYDYEKADEAPMPAPESPDMPVNEPKPTEPAPDQPTEQAKDERQIIYTASLQMAVYELDEVMAFAEDIPRRHGGWIQARYDYQITLRVPADHLQVVIAELSERGDVLGKTLQADDVTAQYTDLASRIAVLEQLLIQLELLLKEAKTVEDSLKVRQELERVRIELESAKAQMRQLSESISFSTLTLSLSVRGPVESVPSSNDPFPWVDELGVESTEYR